MLLEVHHIGCLPSLQCKTISRNARFYISFPLLLRSRSKNKNSKRTQNKNVCISPGLVTDN
jgi:hypothetical protein